MKTTFDMDALRTMVVGVELGNFARAATQLGRSQSAVSMQLKKLEQQADRPLFRRNGRSLVPTEAGDALLEYARRIIALNDEAAASLGTIAAASLRIGMPQDFVEDVIPDDRAFRAPVAGRSRRGAGRSKLRPRRGSPHWPSRRGVWLLFAWARFARDPHRFTADDLD